MADVGFNVASRPKGVAFDMDRYRRPGGVFPQDFCAAPHPDNPDRELEPDNFNFHFCRRQKGHEDRDDLGHSAFTFSIAVPEYWDA